MHGLGTLTRGTQRILATSPLRRRLSPQRKPPQRQRGPGADGARRSGGSQHAARQNRPGPMGKPGADGARQSKGDTNSLCSNLMSLRSRRRTARGPWSILTARARCSRPKGLLRGPRARPAHELPRPPEGAACAATPSPPFENRPAACCARATGPQIAATEGSFT